MKNYLIMYDDEFSYYCEAESVKNCLLQFLNYIGEARAVMIKALEGLSTEKEMVDFINITDISDIEVVYEINKAIYSKADAENKLKGGKI